MHTRREVLKLFGKVALVAGVVAAVPTALFGAPVPTVSKDEEVADCECDCKCDPVVPAHEHAVPDLTHRGDPPDSRPHRAQHEHCLSCDAVYPHEHHMISQSEMPSHLTPGWVSRDA